jgi:hypothetical protein
VNDGANMQANSDHLKSVGLIQQGEHQVIFRIWRNPFAYALGSITLMLAGFCAVIFSATSAFSVTHPIQIIPVGFSLIAGVMGYITLVNFINRTKIIVNESAIQITNGPLPWRKGFLIPREEIVLLLIRSSTTTYDATKATFYHVYARLKGNQKEICILDGDISMKEAEFVVESLSQISGLSCQKAESTNAAI